MTTRYNDSMTTHYVNMTQHELQAISRNMDIVEDRLETWLELPVQIACRVSGEDELTDPNNSIDIYTLRLKVDGREVYRVTDDCPASAVDLLGAWAVRNLIINCGYTGNYEYAPEAAEA